MERPAVPPAGGARKPRRTHLWRVVETERLAPPRAPEPNKLPVDEFYPVRVEGIIPGIPVPQPRPRVTRFGTYVPKKHPIHEYRQRVAIFVKLAARKVGLYSIPKDEPCWVTLDFHLSWKQRDADLDNLTKGFLDGLQQCGFLPDDRCVVRLQVEKFYAISEIDEPYTAFRLSW